jgi:hypothetical protein
MPGERTKTPELFAPSNRRPICSSIAHPTSAPLGESMTADGPVMSGPLTGQTDRVTDISSKGLLPQLIDVLEALTEAQELLWVQVRNARLASGERATPLAP